MDIDRLPKLNTPAETGRLDIDKLAKPSNNNIDGSELYTTPMDRYYGRHTSDLNTYSPYFNQSLIPTWQGFEALNEARAKNQTAGQLWKGVADQIVMGTIVGGTLSNVGSLLQIPQAIGRFINYTDDKWQENFLQSWGHSFEEAARERSPIHMTERAQRGAALGDRTWWASHAPSIMTTVALIAPTRAATLLTMKLGSMAVRGMKLKRAFDTTKAFNAAPWYVRAASTAKTKNITETLVSSLYSRHMYSTVESMDNYRRDTERYLDLGMSAEDAHAAASKSANYNYRLGYLNLWKDMAAWGMLLRKSHMINRGLDARKAALLGKTQYKGQPLIGQSGAEALAKGAGFTGKSSGRIVRDWLTHGVLEGVEEYNIQWQKKEASRRGDVKAGLDIEDTSFIERLIAHTGDPLTFDSFFWGMLGGLAFGSVGQYGLLRAEQGRNKKAQDAGDTYIKELETIIDTNRDIVSRLNKEDLTSGDVAMADLSGINLEEHLLQGGLVRGDLGVTIELLNNLSEMSNEQLVEWGAGENSQQRFKDMANSLQEAGNAYNTLSDISYGFGQQDSYIHIDLATRRYKINRLKQLRDEYSKTGNDTRFNDMDFGEVTNAVQELTLKRERANQLQLNKAQAESSINKLNQDIAKVETKINELKVQRNKLINDKSNQKAIDLLSNQIAKLEHQNIISSGNIEVMQNAIKASDKFLNNVNNEIKAYQEAINKVEDADTKKQITAFIESAIKSKQDAIKEGRAELYQLTNAINERINTEESIYNDIANNRESQQKLIDKINDIEKSRNDKVLKDTESLIATLSQDSILDIDNSIKSLNEHLTNIGEDNKKATSLINKKIKELEKRKKKMQDDESFASNYKSVVDHLVADKAITELSNELQAFYKTNQKTIDDRVKQLKKDKKDKGDANEKAKAAKAKIVNEIAKTEDAKVLFKDSDPVAIIDAVFDTEFNVIPYSKARSELIDLYTYIFALDVAANYFLTTNSNLIEKIGANMNSILSDMLQDNVTLDQITALEGKPAMISELADKVKGKHTDLSIEDLNEVINHIAGESTLIKAMYDSYLINNTPEDTSSDKGERFVNGLNDLLNRIPDTKLSENLNNDISKAMAEYSELANEIIKLISDYYGDRDGSVNILDVAKIMVDNGAKDSVINNWGKLNILFDSIASNQIFRATGIIKDGIYTKNNLQIDFKTIPNQQKVAFIRGFIDNYEQTTKDANPVSGTYAYLHDVINLEPNTPLNEEQVKALEAFLQTEIGDNLTLVYQPKHKYDSGVDKYKNRDERNANPLTIPVAIMKDGVRIGFIQEIPMAHHGVVYADENGTFRPFSKHVPDSTYYLFAEPKVQEALQKFYDGDIEFGKLEEKVKNAIDNLAKINRDANHVPTNEGRRHVIAPMFFKRLKGSTYNLAQIKNAYKSHANRFTSDTTVSTEIRNKFNTDNNTVLEVKGKSANVRFGTTFKHSINDRIAPINTEDGRRVVIVYHDTTVQDRSSADLMDIHTGEVFPQPIKLKAISEDTTSRQPYAVHNIGTEANPVYQLTAVRVATLGSAIDNSDTSLNKYHNQIKEKLRKTLYNLYAKKDLTPEQIREIKNELRLLVQYDTHTKDNPRKTSPTFNFTLNDFGKGDFSYEFSTRRKVGADWVNYRTQMRYKHVDGSPTLQVLEFRPDSNGNPPSKENALWVNITNEEAGNYFNYIKRSFSLTKNKIDSENEVIDPVTNKKYESYEDYIFSTNALQTNVDAMLDGEGRPITNSIPSIGKRSNPAGIIVEPISKPTQPTPTPTPTPTTSNPVDAILGKTLEEAISGLNRSTSRYLFDIIKQMDIDVKIGNKLIEHGEAEWDGTNINIGKETREKSAKRESFLGIKLDHEMVHVILDAAQAKMTPEQRDAYHKQIKDFVDDLKKQDISHLLEVDVKRFKKAIEVIESAMLKDNYQEVFAYAFGNEYFPRILSSLQGSNTTTEGFWSKLYNIIKDVLQLVGVENTKLTELTSILDSMLNDQLQYIGEVANPNTTITEKTTDTTTKSDEVKNASKKAANLFKPKKKSENINAIDFYHTNRSAIINRYGIDNINQFVEYYNELSDNQKRELLCI